MCEYIVAKNSSGEISHPSFLFRGIRMHSPVFSDYFDAVEFLFMLEKESKTFQDYFVYEVEIDYKFV